MDSLFKPESEPEPYPPYYEPAPYYEPDPYYEPEPYYPVESVFNVLFIFDWDGRDDGDGSAGVDVCGVSADCANAISADLVLGEGMLCEGESPDCLTSRIDANAALDVGEPCEAETAPSDYASLGQYGALLLAFDADLRGCQVQVVALETEEAWEAFVCDGVDLGTAICLGDWQSVHFQELGGPAVFDVPTE